MKLLVITLDGACLEIGECGVRGSKLCYELEAKSDFPIDDIVSKVEDYSGKISIDKNNTYSILFVESILISLFDKRQLNKLLSDKLQFLNILFIPGPLICSLDRKLATHNLLVVDIEYDHIICTPVYDYRILDECITISTLSICDYMEDNGIDDYNAIDIKTIIMGENGSSMVSYEGNEMPLFNLIKRTLIGLPIDIRNELQNNILICGYLNKEIIDFFSIGQDNDSTMKFIKNHDSLWHNATIFGDYLTKNNDSFHPTVLQFPDWFQSKF